MRQITEQMKRQWGKMMVSCFDYLPTKYQANAYEWKVRKYVWGFKNGQYAAHTAKVIAQRMFDKMGANLKDVVFACIPASSAEKNEIRYKAFAAEVCRLTGAINAFQFIHVEGQRLAIHESANGKHLEDTEVISFDSDFFKGKKVVVFDDIITRGYSYAKFACTLESLGASVLGGLFLAKTINH